MSEDLLRALGRHQREELDAPDPSEADDELSRPFDADEQVEILDGLFERLDAEPSDPVTSSNTQPAPPSEGAQVVRPTAWRRSLVVAVLAAAAAVLLWWMLPAREPELVVATVPRYEFSELTGGIAGQRSEPVDAANSDDPVPELELERDSKIVWVLTPAEPTRRAVGVSLLARSASGESRFVPRVDATVSEPGAIRMAGPLSQFVALDPGIWTITLFVAEPELLPKHADADAGAWRTLSLRVTIVEPQ